MPGWVGWVVAAVAVGAAGLVGARCLAIVAAMARRLDDLEAGRRVRPVRTRGVGPLGRLARRFNEVAPGIESRIARLERDGEQLRVVLGGMVEGVLAVDSRRRLLFANAGADALFGLDARSVGRFLPELIRSPPIQEAVEATLAGPGAYTGEVTLTGREPFPRPHARTPAGSTRAAAGVAAAERRGARLPRRQRAEAARKDAPGFRGQRLARAEDAAGRDQGVHRNPARLGPCTTRRSTPASVCLIEEQAERLEWLILDLLRTLRPARLGDGDVSMWALQAPPPVVWRSA